MIVAIRLLGAALVFVASMSALGARPSTKTVPLHGLTTPAPDPEAERIFDRAQAVWRDRQEVPYVTYAALQIYKHSGKSFSDWWQEYYRDSDRRLIVSRIIDPEEEKKRLKGFPIDFFAFKVADTNANFPPIHVDEPIIEPFDSFGMTSGLEPAPAASAVIEPIAPPPRPVSTETPLREIGRVEVETRVYDVRLIATEALGRNTDYHLVLTPLVDPKTNRLRELWVSTTTYATDKLVVAGIYNGEPYDAVRWLVSYTTFGGRQYVQQIKAQEPLRFGLATIVPSMEIDFVDYRFETISPYIFDRLRF